MGFFRNTIRKFDDYSLKQINDNFMNLWKKVFGNIEYGDLKDNIESKFKLEKNGSFTSLVQEVSDVDGKTSTNATAIAQKADSIELSATQSQVNSNGDAIGDNAAAIIVNANSITSVVSDVEGNSTAISQKADAIDLAGKVNFSDLTDGTTTISGDNITTGTINADRIKAGTMDVARLKVGTFTGFGLKTAASGTRVEMIDDDVHFYHKDYGHVGKVGMYGNDLWVYSSMASVHIEAMAVGDHPGSFVVTPSGCTFNGTALATVDDLVSVTAKFG